MTRIAIALLMAIPVAGVLGVEDVTIRTLIKQLEADEFEIREAASRQLGTLPREYAKILLVESFMADSPEAKYRLRVASKAIFLARVIRDDVGWLSMHGSMGFMASTGYDSTLHSLNRPQREKEDPESHASHRLWWVDVTFPGSDAEQKLKQDDIVVAIDGESIDEAQQHGTLPDKEYRLTVMRPNRERNEDDNKVHGLYPEDYTQIEVTIKSMWKDYRDIDRWESAKIEDYEEGAWHTFMDAAKAEADQEMAPK